MMKQEVELVAYEKGDFIFYLPTFFEHVESEGFVEHFEAEEFGRVSIECLPLLGENIENPAELMENARTPGPDEVAGPFVQLASGFVMQSYRHRDEETPNFWWITCELVYHFQAQEYGLIRFFCCLGEERMGQPTEVAVLHLLRICARNTSLQ